MPPLRLHATGNYIPTSSATDSALSEKSGETPGPSSSSGWTLGLSSLFSYFGGQKTSESKTRDLTLEIMEDEPKVVRSERRPRLTVGSDGAADDAWSEELREETRELSRGRKRLRDGDVAEPVVKRQKRTRGSSGSVRRR